MSFLQLSVALCCLWEIYKLIRMDEMLMGISQLKEWTRQVSDAEAFQSPFPEGGRLVIAAMVVDFIYFAACFWWLFTDFQELSIIIFGMSVLKGLLDCTSFKGATLDPGTSRFGLRVLYGRADAAIAAVLLGVYLYWNIHAV